MSNIFKDKRFSHVASNPRFKRVPRKERKVKIDKRFQSMFTDERFQVKYTVDERGRQVNQLQTDNYKKYYDLTESSDSESIASEENNNSELETEVTKNNTADVKISQTSDLEKRITSDEEEAKEENEGESVSKSDKESLKNIPSNNQDIKVSEKEQAAGSSSSKTEVIDKIKEAHKEVNKFVDEVHKTRLNEKVREKLTDITVDYARGIGTLLSGSESSSDESSSEDSEFETIEHPWGELDKDAEETEEISSRLAVCNMDWDRVTAKDLMVLFHSFLPADGIIESVTIYPSEFGLARMAEEELKGPKELVECKGDTIITSDEEIEEGSAYQREKLREYQLKRLKYYYAVIVCNTPEAANTLYTECDGLEYESSATKLDLRFIADDVIFDQKPHDICTALPDLKKYKPRLFINTALQQGTVNLTWDETDPNRIDFTRKVLAGEEVDENEVKAYLASSSSEDDEETNEKPDLVESEEDDNIKNDNDRIMKYRSLVSNLHDASDRKKGDVEMEVTWGTDSTNKDHTTFTNQSGSENSESEEDLVSSSDEKLKKHKKNKKNSKSISIEENENNSLSEEENRNAELELLLAEDDPDERGRRHFNLKAIQKEEKEGSKKKKWRRKKKKDVYQEEDSFKIDTTDNRFSALFTSHHFNIDPADPHFRKTKAMNELIAEKQKRRKLEAS